MNLSLSPALARLRAPGGLPKLPPGFVKGLLPIVLLALAITALVLMFAWNDQAGYKPVFGSREKVASAEMIALLDAQGIPYRLHPDSGQVLVPSRRLGEVRMLLAAKGVVAKLPQGLELMDRNDPLGVSQFVQDVRFRRGLEGELVQSIMTLDAVDSARVHLSIARSSSFVVNDGEKSTASVVLALKAGRSLSPEQIAAIINMVANSVASLDPQRVSVVDQAGNLLSARVDLSEGFEGAQLNDASHRFRDETQRNAEDLLLPMLGTGNYKVSVTAEVDNDRIQETTERYGEAPKITNEAMRTENGRDPLAIGVPGSLSNRPVAVKADGAKADEEPEAATTKKNATTRQYAYDRSVTQVKRSRGRLKKLSVAVVMNNAAAPDGKTWTPEALANVDKVLRSGLGIDAARGDSLVVTASGFRKPVDDSVAWWQQRDNVIEMGSWLAYAISLLLAFLFVVRPLMKLAQQRLALPAVETVAELAEAQEPATPELAAPAAHAALAAPDTQRMPVAGLLENYDLPAPGSPVDVMVEHLKVLSAKEPERVAEVVRQWMQKNGRSE
ncbi:MAG: flagellar M-ring protein FliF [Proteobacteria bacterium]|nr:flagellar M-ring protein FliF [Pseudomonadota bacterium]